MSKNYLQLAKELYPNKYFWDYDLIIEIFGNILLKKYVGYYQGDILVLYKHDDGSYSYLCFGYGSCSGTDALQSCVYYEDVADLMKKLNNERIIRDNAEDMLAYFENKDWELEYFYGAGDKKFREKAKEILKEEIK